MKIGVIGLGAIAPYFLSAIEADPACVLAAVCDLDEAKLAPHAERGIAAFSNIDGLLDAGVVDAVILTLPNDQHAPAAIKALRRKVHVCCEKPLTVTAAEATTLIRASQESGATLFTAFHRRYNRNLSMLVNQLREVPAGQIAKVTARYHEDIIEHTGGDRWYLDPARSGGGCLIDNGPNAIDTVWRLLGPLTLRDAVIGDVRSGAEFYAELDLVSAEEIPVRIELDWALATGEIKDVTVQLRDGRVLTADLLAGFTGFKSSLSHEYAGILTAFRAAVEAGPHWIDSGPAIVQLIEDAYKLARRREERSRMQAKELARARVIKLLFHHQEDRGMTLSPWDTRCVASGEVHELVTTIDRPARPGDRVDRVGFLGFAEFQSATVLGRGDQVLVGDRRIGTIRGFDECHFPNHYNILIETDQLFAAGDLDLRLGDEVHFAPPEVIARTSYSGRNILLPNV